MLKPLSLSKITSARKPLFLILAFFLIITTTVEAQYQDEAKDPSSGSKYSELGRLVTALPSGALLYETGTGNAKDLLVLIRAAFKERYLFIDFWATWCQPCLEEMPGTKELYKETKGLPIEFIYICSDYETSISSWADRVSSLDQPGIHLYVNNATINGMFRILSIPPAFPAHVLLDKTGKPVPGLISDNSLPDPDTLRKYIIN